MEKIKSILASAAGKKPGPPVPPRPSQAAVQKALEKTRKQSPILGSVTQTIQVTHAINRSPPASPNFAQVPIVGSPGANKANPPVAYGRTVVYSSAAVDRQCDRVNGETQCFDIKSDDSSTGFTSKHFANGNSAQVSGSVDANSVKLNGEVANVVNNLTKGDNEPTRVILHHKSPVPRPRSIEKRDNQASLKVSTVLINSKPLTEANYQLNSYASLIARNQNFPSRDAMSVKSAQDKLCQMKTDQVGSIKFNQEKFNKTKSDRDDELKQKLLNEMMNKSNLVETTNRHVKYNGSNLKRASSFDVLNEAFGDKAVDKKVIFQELLISELSEMRRDSNPRLSSAKSSPDISPNGNLNIFEMNEKHNTFVSLEDSGVEDEGKMDDCSSSGVGDSWDSCKEMENR